MATKTPSVDSVRSALKEVIEPVLGRDIVSLGMVKKIEIDRDAAFVTLEIPTPVYRDRTGLEERARAAALKAPGISDVRVLLNVNVPMGNRGAATRLPSVRNVIAVAAGKGGVGKSTVATNLALALREHGARVLPLPHPSPRNNGWLQRNPWFEADVLPELKTRVRALQGR